MKNPITEAIVYGGLEPFEQFYEIGWFIRTLRNSYCCNDDIVIYTGYMPEEIDRYLAVISEFENIIVKFGRFLPGHTPHYDDVLGVSLASDNQYAVKIS